MKITLVIRSDYIYVTYGGSFVEETTEKNRRLMESFSEILSYPKLYSLVKFSS